MVMPWPRDMATTTSQGVEGRLALSSPFPCSSTFFCSWNSVYVAILPLRRPGSAGLLLLLYNGVARILIEGQQSFVGFIGYWLSVSVSLDSMFWS